MNTPKCTSKIIPVMSCFFLQKKCRVVTSDSGRAIGGDIVLSRLHFVLIKSRMRK